MNYFKAGQFFGQSNQTVLFDGITVTETVYDYEFIDWHYHENPHFSFVLFGNTCEGNSRETYECSADTLLFHNCRSRITTSNQRASHAGFNCK